MCEVNDAFASSELSRRGCRVGRLVAKHCVVGRRRDVAPFYILVSVASGFHPLDYRASVCDSLEEASAEHCHRLVSFFGRRIATVMIDDLA